MCVSAFYNPTPSVTKPAPIQAALQAPTESDTKDPVAAIEDDKKRRAAAAFGQSKTILTGSEGDLSAYQTEKKNLLGL